MPEVPRQLLSAALRVKWESGSSGDRRAVELIAQRVPGYTPEEYAEASRQAAAMDGVAYELAAAWFVSAGKGPPPTVGELEARCPGFSEADYAEAIRNNTLWARR